MSHEITTLFGKATNIHGLFFHCIWWLGDAVERCGLCNMSQFTSRQNPHNHIHIYASLRLMNEVAAKP